MPATDSGIRVLIPAPSDCADILSPAALHLLGALARRFEPERQRLLARRRERKLELDAGRLPDFLPETKQIRDSDWTVAPIRPDLTDRRVEITGPVERKMMINALNSGANVFMADFEDANAPTWENNLRGQQNVRDAVTRTIAYTSPGGKRYALERKTATLVVRPRGWHLVEKHLVVDGQPISASLFDFGLTFFHTAAALVASGSGPYFFLPKLHRHLGARTCRRRGLQAMGGVAAQIPTKRDAVPNAQAPEKVRQAKLREVGQGPDGTSVAPPGLLPVAREVFDGHMSGRGPHQIGQRRE